MECERRLIFLVSGPRLISGLACRCIGESEQGASGLDGRVSCSTMRALDTPAYPDHYRGFGRIMAHTPMIMMWANVDRSVTLSQRTAPREQEPEVVKNPPFRAVPSRTNTLVSPLLLTLEPDGGV